MKVLNNLEAKLRGLQVPLADSEAVRWFRGQTSQAMQSVYTSELARRRGLGEGFSHIPDLRLTRNYVLAARDVDFTFMGMGATSVAHLLFGQGTPGENERLAEAAKELDIDLQFHPKIGTFASTTQVIQSIAHPARVFKLTGEGIPALTPVLGEELRENIRLFNLASNAGIDPAFMDRPHYIRFDGQHALHLHTQQGKHGQHGPSFYYHMASTFDEAKVFRDAARANNLLINEKDVNGSRLFWMTIQDVDDVLRRDEHSVSEVSVRPMVDLHRRIIVPPTPTVDTELKALPPVELGGMVFHPNRRDGVLIYYSMPIEENPFSEFPGETAHHALGAYGLRTAVYRGLERTSYPSRPILSVTANGQPNRILEGVLEGLRNNEEQMKIADFRQVILVMTADDMAKVLSGEISKKPRQGPASPAPNM